MSTNPPARIRLTGGTFAPWSPHQGGLERFGAWLQATLRARGALDGEGVSVGVRARFGGQLVRCADGCTRAWADAMSRHPLRDVWRVHQERRALRQAEFVIALSPKGADELARLYGREDAVVLVNPLLTALPPRAPQAASRLLCVGHGFERRGLDFVLAAMHDLPDLELDVLGRDREIARWRAAVEAMGLAGRVRFLGAVDAGAHLASAAALVHAARYEPWGNIVAEAAAMGVPAIASDVTGAACMLHPDHRWALAEGPGGLAARVRAALERPRSALWLPPSESEYVDSLLALAARVQR